MLHYPAASSSSYGSYSSYTSYPSYPSGLLLLSRYSNARYARLDVPDWEFRPRPGQNRSDPSGAISRGRSVVRIRTGAGKRLRGKTPGARLVEKFIIRGPTGSAASEAGGRFAKNPGPVSGKDDRGGAGPAISVSDCADQYVKTPENPSCSAEKRATVSRRSPESPKLSGRSPEPVKHSGSSPQSPQPFKPSQKSPEPENSPKSPHTPPTSENTPTNSPTTDFDEISTPLRQNSTKEEEISLKSKKKLKTYGKSKKTDLLKKEPDKCDAGESDSQKAEISSEIPVETHLAEQVSKSQSLKENTVDFVPENAQKLLNFTAKAPPGVQKVQPLKPHFDNNQIHSDSAPSNCVSETKVKVPTNAKCAEAKTRSKFSVPISTNQITGDGGRNSENPIEFEGKTPKSNSTEKSFESAQNPGAGLVKKENEVYRRNKEFSENSTDFSKRKTVEPPKTVPKLDKSQQRATTGGQTREICPESATVPILTQNNNLVAASNLKRAENCEQLNRIDVDDKTKFELVDGNLNKNIPQKLDEKLSAQKAKESESENLTPKGQKDSNLVRKSQKDQPKSLGGTEDTEPKIVKTLPKDSEPKKVKPKGVKSEQRVTVKAKNVENVEVVSENCVKNGENFGGLKEAEPKKDKRNPVVQTGLVKAVENSSENGDKIACSQNGENGVVKVKNNKTVDDNNNGVLCLRDLSELGNLYEEFRVVGAETKREDLGEDWEILEVVVDMEGTKKKKKVIVKKKGSKVKVTPIEAKPPSKQTGDVTARAGDVQRHLSKKRVSLADDELNLVGFPHDRKTSITDEVLVEEAALLDKMIRKELRDARKSSLAFPPIAEDKEVAEALADLAAKAAKTPSPKRAVPSPQERREMWKKNALRQSKKGLGGLYRPKAPTPAESSSSESSECDVNCHQKCQQLMPNLCGVNQKLMVEALQCLKRDRRSASGPHTRTSLFKLDSESEDSQCDGRVTPPAPPAKTLPRFRTYTINDFQFLKVLGKGSFGKVLLAELKGSQCYYAVKCLKKDVVLEDDDVECTMIERKVLALGTGHPYFCHLFCTFQTESHLFFVMEYLNGGDLMFHIQQSGRFDEGRARFYAAEIVSALAFLHKLGIVYRDLKLDNVLLDFDGHVRIADFGMCKLQIYLDKTTDTFCGTPDYMAPEIIKGLNYNHCVDWWSFGILLYEMLVGQSPFSGCDEDHLFWSICNERPHMPRHLSQNAVAILRELLEKDWTKRLGSSEFGSQDVQNHRFFDGMRWHMLERRQVDPPYKPTTKHPLDTKYFDRAFTSEKPVLTPVDKAILESMDQSQFEGFSYTNPNATE